jgi:hypothetical protein
VRDFSVRDATALEALRDTAIIEDSTGGIETAADEAPASDNSVERWEERGLEDAPATRRGSELGADSWIDDVLGGGGRGSPASFASMELDGLLDDVLEAVKCDARETHSSGVHEVHSATGASEVGDLSMSGSTEITATAGTRSRGRVSFGSEGLAAEGFAEASVGVSAEARGRIDTPLGSVTGSVRASAELYARAQGYVRLHTGGIDAEGAVEAGAVARVEATSDAHLMNGLLRAHGEAYAEAGAGARATAAVHAALVPPEAAARLKAEAFAGARAGFNANVGAPGAGASVAGEVWAGAGVKAVVDAGLHDGKFKLEAQLGAAVGVGGSIRLGLEVDFNDPQSVAEAVGSILLVSTGIGLIGALSPAPPGGAASSNGSAPAADLGQHIEPEGRDAVESASRQSIRYDASASASDTDERGLSPEKKNRRAASRRVSAFAARASQVLRHDGTSVQQQSTSRAPTERGTLR